MTITIMITMTMTMMTMMTMTTATEITLTISRRTVMPLAATGLQAPAARSLVDSRCPEGFLASDQSSLSGKLE